MSRAKQQTQNQQKVFTRRLAILGGMKALMVGTLAARLYYLQVIEGENRREVHDDPRVVPRVVWEGSCDTDEAGPPAVETRDVSEVL